MTRSARCAALGAAERSIEGASRGGYLDPPRGEVGLYGHPGEKG